MKDLRFPVCLPTASKAEFLEIVRAGLAWGYQSENRKDDLAEPNGWIFKTDGFRPLFGIYCILNTINGKFYIGQTSVSFSARWLQHSRDLRAGRHVNKLLQSSWNKYASAQFIFFPIEIVSEVKDLLKREVFWKESLKPEFDLEKTSTYWDDSNKRAALSKFMKERGPTFAGKTHKEHSKAKMSARKKGRPQSEEQRQNQSNRMRGQRQSESFYEGNKREIEKRKTPIEAFDLDGRFVARWESMTDASQKTLSEVRHVRRGILDSIREGRPYHDLYFRYGLPKDQPMPPFEFPTPARKYEKGETQRVGLECFDEFTGVKIKEWISVATARENGHDPRSIQRSEQKVQPYHGMYWREIRSTNPPFQLPTKRPRVGKAKPIVVINESNGQEVEYMGRNEAARALGVEGWEVREALKKGRLIGNFRFKDRD